MAILKDVILDSGLLIPNAYHTILTLNTDRQNNTIFSLGTFVNEEYSKDGHASANIQNYSFIADVSDSAYNIKKQAYEYLKTLDIFSQSIDA